MPAIDAMARQTLTRLIVGFRATHLLAAAAEIGLADLLAAGPRTSAELAVSAGANPDALHRVMRALAQLDVLTMHAGGSFALTPLGMCLRTDVEGSLHGVARMWGSEAMQRPFLSLANTLKTGEPAFGQVFGVPCFEYLATHPNAGAVFNAGMAGQTAQVSADVVGAYDFSPFRTLVDVGGGNGLLIATILRAYPDLRGVIFDLPHSRQDAIQQLVSAGLEQRCEFVGGDFFDAVPAGADAYVLKYIIHDWDDERSVAILRTCRRAMQPESRLLLVERLLPEGSEPNPDAMMSDLTMLVLTGGRERTTAEYRALLASADLDLVRVVSTAGQFSVLEAAPASTRAG